MKRNKLFLLLVAVLLAALLSTSAAFAEAAAATPKLTPADEKKVSISEKLTGDKKDQPFPGVTYNVEGVEDGYVVWTSSDENSVAVSGTTWINGETVTPTLTFKEPCKDAKITGVLWTKDKNYDEYRKSSVTVSFPVTLEFVASKKIKGFKEEKGYKFYKAGETKEFVPQLEYVAPAEGAEVLEGTYANDPELLRWKVDDTEYAEVNKGGVVTIKKLPKDKAVTVKLTVSVKGEAENTASTTLEIQPELNEDDSRPDREKGTITGLSFTADTFTFIVGQGGINLVDNAYLDVKGSKYDDVLLWSSDNMDCVELSTDHSTYRDGYTVQRCNDDGEPLFWKWIEDEEDEYGGHYEKTTEDTGDPVLDWIEDKNQSPVNLYIKKATTEPVTITVKSKLNPELKATVKVVVKAAEEAEDTNKAYENVEFIQDDLTVYVKGHWVENDDGEGEFVIDEAANLQNYLNTKGGKGDSLIWTSDDPHVVSVTTTTGRITAYKVGEATITAKSKLGEKSDTIKIKVIEDPDWEMKAYKSLSFTVPSLTVYPDWQLIDLNGNGEWDEGEDWEPHPLADLASATYLTKKGGEGDDIIWLTSDNRIAWVDNGNLYANNAGTATITVKSKLGDAKDKIEIIVKEDLPPKPVPFATVTQAVKELTLYSDDDDYLENNYVTTTDSKANDYFVWTTTDSEIVDVDVWSGHIWAHKPGTATVTGTAAYGGQKVEFAITVKEEKDKPNDITEIKAVVSELTVYEYEDGNAMDYVTVTPEEDWRGDDVIWSSSDLEVVKIDTYGWFQPRKVGTATLTAKSKNGGATPATIKVTVKEHIPVPYKEIKLAETALTLLEGDVQNIWAYLTVDEQWGNDDHLIWTSSDEDVATVTHNSYDEDADQFQWEGEVTAKKAGTATITIRSYLNPDLKKTMTITVKKPTEKTIQSVKFTEDKFTVNLAKTNEFDAKPYTVIDPVWEKLEQWHWDEEKDQDVLDGYSDTLVWTSSNPQIAVVEDGNVYLNRDGVKFGDEPVEVTITARSKNNAEAKPASFTLTVKNEKVAFTKITATQATLTLKAEDIVYLGDYGTFESFGNYVTVEPADADDDLVWTSSDPYIVEAAEGWLYIKKPGTATITARSALDPTVEPATITVTVPEEKPVELGFINDAPKKLRFDQYEGDFEEEELAIASLDLNKYLTAKPVYYASDEDYREKLVWKTSNPQVALVYNGIVYFMAPGDVTITVYDESYTVKAETELTLLKPVIAKIGMNASELAMKTGEEELAWLNMRVLKQDNGKYITKGFSAYDIIWTSSNPHVVDIGKEDGIMTAGEPGTAKITASIVNDEDGSIATGSFTVEVTKVDVESIKFAKSKYTINSSADRYSTVLKFKVSPVNADFNPNDYIVKTEKRVVADVWFEDESTVGLMVNGSGTTTIVIRRASDNKLMAKTKVVVKPLYVDGIRIKEKNVRMNFYKLDDLRLYQNMQVITPVIKPANADYTVRWETSDASVAFVNWFDSLTNEVIDDSSLSSYKMSGTEARIIATGAGQATLTMTVDDGKKVRTAKVKVVVTTRQIVPKLNKTKATITMIKGEDKSLQLTATDKQTGEPIEVKWSSSDKKIAKVTKNGLVKPLKAGKVTITATSTDGLETKATCKITIKQNPVKALKVKKTELTMTVGEEKTLKVKVKPTDAYDKGLTFKSSKSKVVSVDKDGKLVAKKAGKATITAKATDGSKKSVKITVTVKAAEETEAK